MQSEDAAAMRSVNRNRDGVGMRQANTPSHDEAAERLAQAKWREVAQGAEGFAEISRGMFRLRKGLSDQFSLVERQIVSGRAQSFLRADGDEARKIVQKLNQLREELDESLVRLEAQMQSSVERVVDAMGQKRGLGGAGPGRRMPELGQYLAGQAGIDESVLEEFFQGLNFFNLRRKYHELSLSLRSEEVDEFGYDPVFDSFLRPLFDFLYQKYWRIETYGMLNVPRDGKVLLVGNHSGSLPYDATMLKYAIQKEHPGHRPLRFMVEDFLFHFPFLGTLMNRFGGVRASQDNAESLLDRDLAVVVFPEGVKGLGKLYRDKYHLARFGRGGFVRLCLRTGAPLVPVAFIGPEEIHPMIYRDTRLARLLGLPYIPVTPTFPWLGPLGLIPLPSKWSIHILTPIDFSSYGPGAENDRVLVAKMSRMVKDLLQDTIVDKLKERRSIWFG
jgi:1-acyl-sn-glycerol-3-phosphate acyltransferase